MPLLINHILPSAMAGPAKINRLHGTELSRIKDLFASCFFRGQIHPDWDAWRPVHGKLRT